jgi:hypothetical protein
MVGDVVGRELIRYGRYSFWNLNFMRCCCPRIYLFFSSSRFEVNFQNTEEHSNVIAAWFGTVKMQPRDTI